MTDNGYSGNSRLTLQTQASTESSISSSNLSTGQTKSRVLSVIGITRKRSNANSKDEKSLRTSFNSQTSLIRESSPDTAMPPRSVNGKQDQQRLCVNTAGSSRPSSGQFLLTSTPNHSRSPSITSNSNRDSMQSNDGSFTLATSEPPPVPPKSRFDTSNEEYNVMPIQEHFMEAITTQTRKKKAPPPPPPTSPKKPPVKPYD